MQTTFPRLLLEHAGLAVVPLQAFGLHEESGWFRLSVGAVSHGNVVLLGIGLLVSIFFVVTASDLLSKLMDRYPSIVILGAAIVGVEAGELIHIFVALMQAGATARMILAFQWNLAALSLLKREDPAMEVILLTGHGSTTAAIEGMQRGLFDYLVKPVDIGVLVGKILEAAEKRRRAGGR